MAQLDDIKAPVRAQMERFDKMLSEAVKSDYDYLKPITNLILKPLGKKIRPLLTLLTAALHDGINDKTYAAALLAEMIHWSTLIHDDVVDEAYQRRGEWTPVALLRSRSAVLVGDYLFSKGLAVAARADNMQAIKSFTNCIERIVEGELSQTEHARKTDTTLEDYSKIINMKTASLIASAAECGAYSAGADQAQTAAMYRFGELLGMAFQIKDDLLDFGEKDQQLTDNSTGKVLGNDLKERKMTLPLIYAVANIPLKARFKVMKHLREAAYSPESVEWLRQFVFDSEGIRYAESVMDTYYKEAMDTLEAYPESEIRNALHLFGEFITARKK